MKRWLSIFFLAAVFLVSLISLSFSCDFCLLSQGISPLETTKGAGIRINERYTLLDEVYKGTEKVSNPGVKQEFWTTEVTGFYNVAEDIMLLAVVPYRETKTNGELVVNPDGTVNLEQITGNQTGLGDVVLLGRYTFFTTHTIDTTTAAAGLLGIKFPTGKTDGKTTGGAEFLDSHLQLGTGSTDFFVGLSVSHSIARLSLSGNLLAALTTQGKSGNTKHQFGNSLNYDLTAKYRFYPDQYAPAEGPQIFLAIGVNGELREKERADGAIDPNSGGNTTYISPGLQVVAAPHWVFELSYQYAVYHNLYGTQIGEKYRAVGGVTYLF